MGSVPQLVSDDLAESNSCGTSLHFTANFSSVSDDEVNFEKYNLCNNFISISSDFISYIFQNYYFYVNVIF